MFVLVRVCVCVRERVRESERERERETGAESSKTICILKNKHKKTLFWHARLNHFRIVQ